MNIHRKNITTGLIFILLAISIACRLSQSSSKSSLSQALEMIPSDIELVNFTDWTLIKSYMGKENLTSQNSLDDRKDFAIELSTSHFAASCYGCNYIMNMADAWNWDTTDLSWEVTLSSPTQAPIYILKFRDDFNLAPVLALFEERDFSQVDYQGTTIYSHELSLEDEWLRIGELAIVNTAVLAKEKIFILSSQLEGVQAVLNIHDNKKAASLAKNEDYRIPAQRLGEVASAVIATGENACLTPQLMLSPNATLEQIAELRKQLGFDEPKAQQLHAFHSLAIGYRYEGDAPVGFFVFHYHSAEMAKADQEQRRQIAVEGLSLMSKTPYSEEFFTIEKDSVMDTDLVWQVKPINDLPRRLYQIFVMRDMLFAACPE